MKILITGGAGFIGSNLAWALEERKNDVTVIDNFSSGNPENLKGSKVALIEGDITTLDLTSKFKDERFDIVFHQAAITDTTLNDEKEMMRVNIEGFRKTLNFAKYIKAKLIYASSAGVYGRGKIPMKEDQELSPLNSYAFSKKVMDDIVKEEMVKNDMVIIGLRYFNVYGPREKYKGKSASMIYQLYRQMKCGKQPRIFKWGQQKRDFIYVKDVVKANLKAMEVNKSCIVNIGTGTPASFNGIIREISNQILETDYEPEYFDNPYDFYQNETQADTNLAYKTLNFKAEYFIDEGIKDYLFNLEER